MTDSRLCEEQRLEEQLARQRQEQRKRSQAGARQRGAADGGRVAQREPPEVITGEPNQRQGRGGEEVVKEVRVYHNKESVSTRS